MIIDIRENFVEIQYDNVLMIVKETPRRYFVYFNGKYDLHPHIEIRFKNLDTNKNRWFITPIILNMKNTIEKILDTLQMFFCADSKASIYSLNNIYDNSLISERTYTRIEAGDFNDVLDCQKIKGLKHVFLLNKRNTGIELL